MTYYLEKEEWKYCSMVKLVHYGFSHNGTSFLMSIGSWQTNFFNIGQRLLHMEEYRQWEHMLGILLSTSSTTWSHILELDQEAY